MEMERIEWRWRVGTSNDCLKRFEISIKSEREVFTLSWSSGLGNIARSGPTPTTFCIVLASISFFSLRIYSLLTSILFSATLFYILVST